VLERDERPLEELVAVSRHKVAGTQRVGESTAAATPLVLATALLALVAAAARHGKPSALSAA